MNKLGTMLVLCATLALAGCGSEVTAPQDAPSGEEAAGTRRGPTAAPAGPRMDDSPTMIGSGT